VIKHGKYERVKKKSKVAKCRAKVEEQNEKSKKGVAHSWIFEEINVSPKCSDKKCYIAY